MLSLITGLGPMRLLLIGAVVVTLPLAFFTDMEPEGLGLLSAYIAPTLATLLFFVLWLDVLMNRIFMSGESGQTWRLQRTRIRADLAAIGGIVLFWGPYYYSILAFYVD